MSAPETHRDPGHHPAELRIEGALHRWATFSGYEVDGAALRLHRGPWYRATLSLDRGDIEALDAVPAARDRHVPRQGCDRDVVV